MIATESFDYSTQFLYFSPPRVTSIDIRREAKCNNRISDTYILTGLYSEDFTRTADTKASVIWFFYSLVHKTLIARPYPCGGDSMMLIYKQGIHRRFLDYDGRKRI